MNARKENNALGYQIRDYAANLLKASGFQGNADLAASAMAGNFSVESWGFQDRFITGKTVGDQGSEGLAQWREGRLTAFKQWAEANGMDRRDWRTQIAYTVHELKTTERTAWNRMEKAKNINQAVDGMLAFERPQGYKSKDATGSHSYEARLKKSIEFSNKNGSTAIASQDADFRDPKHTQVAQTNPMDSTMSSVNRSEKGDWSLDRFSNQTAMNSNDRSIFDTFNIPNIKIPNLLELFKRG